MPGTIPYPQTRRDTPESILEDRYQRTRTQMDGGYQRQYDEINKRGPVIGRRKQDEMLAGVQSRSAAEMGKFYQMMRGQMDELALIDRLAEQRGFDPYEAKMRMVLGSEAEAAMFPKQETQRSTAAQYGELDVYERKLKKEAGGFLMDPGGRRIKQASKFWFQEQKTKPSLKVWDPNLNPTYDKKKDEWFSGGFRTATSTDWARKGHIDQELEDIQRQKQEILGQPDIATRVRSTMFQTKRDPKTDSLVTRVQKSAGMTAPESWTPRKRKPERQAVVPTAEALLEASRGMKKGSKERQELFDMGVRLGYWE